jgi:hypothetical protein
MFWVLQDQGCLPGLVRFLDNVDPAVINTAVGVSNLTTSPSTAGLPDFCVDGVHSSLQMVHGFVGRDSRVRMSQL